jgi:hypothetical protein
MATATAFADEARRLHELANLSDKDLARATGVAPSTARSWLARNRSPSKYDTTERLAELSAVVDRLALVMNPGYIALWLRKPNRALADEKPLDVIASGGYRRVAGVVSELESPPAA